MSHTPLVLIEQGILNTPYPLLLLWLSKVPRQVDRASTGSPVCHERQPAALEQP